MNWEKYNLIDTEKKLKDLDAYLMNGDKPAFDLMAVDTETNGLHFFKNVIIGLSISVDRERGFYIPLLCWTPTGPQKKRKIQKVDTMITFEGHFTDLWEEKTYPEKVSPKEYRPPLFIQKYVTKWLKAYSLIMHNAPFDCSMFYSNFEYNPAENLFCDTGLLKHFLDENSKNGLKDVAEKWKKALGYSPEESAASEQKELGASVIRNGGKFNARNKHVWRGDYEVVGKYACKDTMLTFGVFEVGMKRFSEKYKDYHHELFFQKEVMPLCKEVVIPMFLHGVYIDVAHFRKLEQETAQLLNTFEDQFMSEIKEHLKDFSKGKTVEQAVSEKALVEAIIEKEHLPYPTNITKGIEKRSLAANAVRKMRMAEPHWLWDYILGEGEIPYSSQEVAALKQTIYEKKTGNRYRFNIASKDHLRWLLFDKLGNDKTKVKQTEAATPEKPIPSVDEEVLETFQARYSFITPLLVYNKLSKLYSTYITPALELNNNGWLHLSMKQNGTTSGRFSCSGGYNLQTLPKVEEISGCPACESRKIEFVQKNILLMDLKCKDCKHVSQNIVCYSVIKEGFVAPPGKKIVNADFSSLEPRAFAYMSGDKKLKAVYKENLDLYSKVYCDMLDPHKKYSADPESPKFLKKIAPDKRSMFKPVVLGIPYGARAPQVARLLGLKKIKDVKEYDKHGNFKWVKKEVLDVEQGKRYRDLYLNTYKDLKQYMEDCEDKAVAKGYIETIIGRRRRFKYVQYIAQLIGHYGISKEDFIEMKPHDLEKEKTPHGLDVDGLIAFSEAFDIPMWKLKKKGFWAYIRGLFINELNNSKNFPIQGLAAHITNKSMLDAVRSFRQNKVSGVVVLQVHDEITCYSDAEDAEKTSRCLKKAMEQNEFAKRIDIPMVADPVICDNLKESK